MDDGPLLVQESIEMGRLAVDDGIKTIVATPHTLNGVFTHTTSDVVKYVADLQSIFNKEKIYIQLCPGSDTRIIKSILTKVQSGEAVTINIGGKYLLIEFPHDTVPEWAKDELFELKISGITPIITHPERNLELQRKPNMVYDFIMMGCLVQVTASSITGEFGEDAMECAHLLLKSRMVHVIASDAHSATRRAPELSDAVEATGKIIGNIQEAEAMVTTHPASILNGDIVHISDPIQPLKKKWFFRFWK